MSNTQNVASPAASVSGDTSPQDNQLAAALVENPVDTAVDPAQKSPEPKAAVPNGDEISAQQRDASCLILETLPRIEAEQKKLTEDFEHRLLEQDERHAGQIDKLLDKNINDAKGIIENFQRRLIRAVIESIDAAERSLSHIAGREGLSDDCKKLLESFVESFGDTIQDFQDALLIKFDVETYRSEEGMPFDDGRHHARKKSPTEDPAKDKKIKQSLNSGYELEGKVLRREFVDLYIYQQPAENPLNQK
ncbi:MAG: nucleotide exchange factor GrpE [Planctomycetaceae bacterium]|jgi:molecular chaperone GrpE (heat shock protein)|nr:nucleotide exchange factor GrpE [Planctomycetaceae bacterium]